MSRGDTRELRLNRAFMKAIRPTAALRPDWGAIVEFTEEVNHRPEKSCSMARSMISNAFKFNTSSVNVYLTTLILEACMHSCGSRFHSEIAKKDFVKSLMSRYKKAVRKREFPALQYYQPMGDYIPTTELELQQLSMAKAMTLVQKMSKTYSNSSYYQPWHEAYQKLLSKGIQMPAFREVDMLPPYITRQGRPQAAPIHPPLNVAEAAPLMTRAVTDVPALLPLSEIVDDTPASPPSGSARSPPSTNGNSEPLANGETSPPRPSAPAGEALLDLVLLHQTIEGCKREAARVERLMRSSIGNPESKAELLRAYQQMQSALSKLELSNTDSNSNGATRPLAHSISPVTSSSRNGQNPYAVNDYNPFDRSASPPFAATQHTAPAVPDSIVARVEEPVRQNLRGDPFVGWLFSSPAGTRRSLPISVATATAQSPLTGRTHPNSHQRSVSFQLSEQIDP